MKSTGKCPKCNSESVSRLSGANQSKIGIQTGALSWVPVTRYLCTTCGFIEQYVDGDKDLKKVAKASK